MSISARVRPQSAFPESIEQNRLGLTRLVGELQEKQRDLDAKKFRIRELVEAIKNFQNQLKIAELEKQRIRIDNDKLHKSCVVIHKKTAPLHNENVLFERELEQIEIDVTKVQKARDAKRAHIEQLKQNIEHERESSSKFEKLIEEMKEELQKQQRERTHYKKQVSEVDKRASQLTERIQALALVNGTLVDCIEQII
eukprot:TRINITY_DN2429_c0_g2_i2.p1 TRINITY_DN2429_c0_g2~~TRINITY_DN2429_c0_g2_i2.p1  ORF type:complete len:197 (-),score=55.11 TRINITY_DN2429_c0_g2_i2:315-905(-)